MRYWAAGVTMARWLDDGVCVYTAVFSTAEKSLPPGAKCYRLKAECKRALDQLGVPEDNRFIYDYPVHELGYHRQDGQLVRLRLVADSYAPTGIAMVSISCMPTRMAARSARGGRLPSIP
jgi:hypothetical protein